jgi:superfamily I DNA/RNA helicase/Txe/YoeB family toxin of Txe-Axe toxin-antitoxin module
MLLKLMKTNLQYEIGATRGFLADVREHAENAALRAHILALISSGEDPFIRSNRPEKLTQDRSVGERYSIRVNDDYRIIFDKVDSKRIIYRAFGKHDPTYRRARRLPRVDIGASLRFPLSAGDPNRLRVEASVEMRTPHVVRRATPEPGDEIKPEPLVVPAQTLDECTTPSIPYVGPETSDEKKPIANQEPSSLREMVGEPCVFFTQNSDLIKAMTGELEDWMLFLPEQQRNFITQKATGPSRVYGASGTGKTCILMHRAVHLARHSQKDVLVLTFRSTLVSYLRGLIDCLCTGDQAIKSRIRVASVLEIATEMTTFKEVLAEGRQQALIREARRLAGTEPPSLKRRFRRGQAIDDFTFCEITRWVKGAANSDREDYETLPLPARKSSLSAEEIDWLFRVLAHYERIKGTAADEQDVLSMANQRVGKERSLRWSAVLVDEFQDLDLTALSFIGNLCQEPENLFFAGDHRQRIYQTLPSFAQAGINIRGRSRQVTMNYRNSPEIYAAARAVLSGAGVDPDGIDASDEQLEFAQPSANKPVLRKFQSYSEESLWVCDRIRALISSGVPPHHIAVISFDITNSASFNWDADFRVVQLHHETVNRKAIFTKGYVKRMTIHQAKGFEFPVVFLMGLTHDLFLNSTFVRTSDDPEDVVRAMLYVGMTRARDTLLMSAPGTLLSELENLSPSLVARLNV